MSTTEMDWPVSKDGCFVPSTTALPHEGDIGQSAHLLASWALEQPSVVAVYLRGSAATTNDGKRPFDVDLVIAVAGLHSAGRKALAHEARKIWEKRCCRTLPLPDLDLLVVDAQRLVSDPGLESTRLLVWLHGVRVAGADLFADLQPVPATATTGRRLLHAQLRATHDGIEWYTSRDREVPIGWLQKRALRIGGVLSLARGGPISRHPARCAALIASVAPQLAALSHAVCADLLAHLSDMDAGSRARELWTRLSSAATKLVQAAEHMDA